MMKDRSIRILNLLRDELPPFRADVAVLFGTELPRLGITCDLIGQVPASQRICPNAWPAGKIWVAGRAGGGILRELLRPFRDLASMLRHVHRGHDVIQVRDKIRAGVFALCLARLAGRPFVYWMSYPFAEDFIHRHLHTGHSRGWLVWFANGVRAKLAIRVFYGIIAPHADHIFVQSEAMREFMMRCGVPKGRMTPVPMGVDMRLFATVARPHALPTQLRNRRVITYLGQLARTRQSDFLLQVVAEVRKDVPDVLLLLVGDAASEADRRWFCQEMERLGVGDCTWLTGWLPQEQALPLVRCADVGLSPLPRGELYDISSPTKAVEYLALSIPCVANDIPDQRLVIEESGGGLCVPMELAPFAAAIEKLLRDPELATRMGESGARWVSLHRTYDQLALTVAEGYRRVVRTPD